MVSSVGTRGAGYEALSNSQAQSQAVDQFFKKVDSDRDGKITKDELTQALESDSMVTGSGSQEPSIDQIFQLFDSGNKGYITKQDATDLLNELQQASSSDATAAPPANGPTRGGEGGGGGAAVSSLDIDPADTNQDGKVSVQEEMAYILKQYNSGTESTSDSQSSTYA